MTDKERIAEAERICRQCPQFFYDIHCMIEDTTDPKTRDILERLETRAYHLQEGRNI